jgi:hypothetical protein
MLSLQNETPFRAALVPGLDKEGRQHLSVVIKGTFVLAPGTTLPIADEQMQLEPADVFSGEAGASSVLYESDLTPAKVGTDVVIHGHAWPRRDTTSLDVEVRVAALHGVLRVFGDRHWSKSLGSWRVSDPARFDRMPLVYERAFGGRDGSEYDERNPIGKGFRPREGAALPNVEAPDELIESPNDRPSPAGVGFVARDWMPRLGYAGTYDDAWRESVAPLLPADFDARFHSAAHPSLVATPHLKGGEDVRLTHLAQDGPIAFEVPANRFTVDVRIRGSEVSLEPVLDTLLIQPDDRRVVATWRVTEPHSCAIVYVERVRVREAR